MFQQWVEAWLNARFTELCSASMALRPSMKPKSRNHEVGEPLPCKRCRRLDGSPNIEQLDDVLPRYGIFPDNMVQRIDEIRRNAPFRCNDQGAGHRGF